MPMANEIYFENYQDFPKHKDKHDEAKPILPKGPSKMTMIFILGYGAALSIMKTKKYGNIKLLLN